MATETRVFESVDNSPEAKAANAAYFAEQGIEAEVEDSAITSEPETPPVTDPAAPAAAAPAATKPGEGEAEETAVDTETAADWDSAQTDGRRKSRYAKKRQEARELKAANEKLERELAEIKATKAPEPKPGEKPPTAGSEATPPAAAAPATEEKFTEAEPVEPKYEDFATADDQLLAYNQALAKHGRDWSRWDRRKEKFEDSLAAQKTRKVDEARTTQTERLTRLTASLAEIRQKRPDFNEVTNNGNVFTPALSGATTAIPGGLELGYQLAKDPVKLKQFNEMTAETQVVDGKILPTQRAWDVAIYLLQQEANRSSAPASPTAGSPPAALPSSSAPREEPAAPRAARGRASDEPGLDQLSGDARRDLRAKQLAS